MHISLCHWIGGHGAIGTQDMFKAVFVGRLQGGASSNANLNEMTKE